jgi:hypothetical protein
MDQVQLKEDAKLVDVTPSDSDTSTVYRVDSKDLLDHTYIIEAPSALTILLKPWIVGSRLANAARASTVEFLRIASILVPELSAARFEDITEVVPLAGSLYYSMAEAFEVVFGETINRCFVGARRHSTPSGWITEISYENFEALSDNPIIMIGDTIATGGTIARILDATSVRSDDIQAIVVYSIAGGVMGAMRLKQISERLDIPIYSFFSNAIFGVEANGTDMPWLHPGTITSKTTHEIAESSYGPILGRNWCAIWDWGDRSKHPLKHLRELLERCDNDLGETEDSETRNILTKIRNEAESALKQWSRPISS